jgi:hypothetical protein
MLTPANSSKSKLAMSNNTFLVIVGTVIALLLGSMLIHKYEDCAERGGKACPTGRYGRSMDPAP